MLQWLRIHLPMQGTQFRWSLIREDPRCWGATESVHCNYWARALEPWNHNYWSHVLQLLKPSCPRVSAPQREEPPQWEAEAPQRRPSATKNNKLKKPTPQTSRRLQNWQAQFRKKKTERGAKTPPHMMTHTVRLTLVVLKRCHLMGSGCLNQVLLINCLQSERKNNSRRAYIVQV